MPIFKLQFQFYLGTEYWTNKFFISAADQGAATTAVLNMAEVFQSALQNSVTIDKCRVTPLPEVRNFYYEVPINQPGEGGSGTLAPLFNVVRLDFYRNLGRGVHHYFRGSVQVSGIGPNGVFTPAAQAFHETFLEALFTAAGTFVDVQGQSYVRAEAAIAVGMRQLRRGSKRKLQPVI